MQSMQCNAMQCNAINAMRYNAMQCNAMQSKSNAEHAVVIAAACDGAWHVAVYARELHDLHKCI